MLDDAYQDQCDHLILFSGDSDLVPAVSMVRQRFPKKRITVYVPFRDPERGAAVEVRTSAHERVSAPQTFRGIKKPLHLVMHSQG